jgi:hypothetical protein
LRFTLRQFLLFVLFLSIPLAALAYGQRMDESSRYWFIGGAFLVVPFLLIVLSAIFLRPGAWRNVLCTALRGVALSGFLLAINWLSGGWYFYVLLIFLLIMTAISPLLDQFGIEVYIPKKCPACQRHGFVPGRLFGDYSSEGSGYTSQPHRYRWCGHCGARLKSRRLQRRKFSPWEDASSPLDDKRYWLWTLSDLRRMLGRDKPSAVADPRDDPAIERVE